MNLPKRQDRQSTRLSNFDYASAGAYFITICAYERALLFGTIQNGLLCPSAVGTIVATCWNAIPSHFQHAALDSFVIMPNHLHGIILINGRANPIRAVGVQHAGPLQIHPHVASGSIGAIVRSFKSVVTKLVNEQRLTPATPIWQRNYHERVIRNDEELNGIRQYIAGNPANWSTDHENPLSTGPRR